MPIAVIRFSTADAISWLFQRLLDTSALKARNLQLSGALMDGFVVKATAPNGYLTWISRAPFGGVPVLGPRGRADVFATKADAYAAIDQMPYEPARLGVQFSIEPAK